MWAIFIASLPLAYFYGKYTAGISALDLLKNPLTYLEVCSFEHQTLHLLECLAPLALRA